MDRRTFDCEQFYRVLARRVQVESCATVTASQAQLVTFKAIARKVTGHFDLWCFLDGSDNTWGRARIAIRAQAMSIKVETVELQRLCRLCPLLVAPFSAQG